MCKYCEDDFKDILLTDDIPLKFGDIDIDTIQANVFINDMNGYELELYIDTNDQPIVKKTVPIKFCPICGRELITDDFRVVKRGCIYTLERRNQEEESK